MMKTHQKNVFFVNKNSDKTSGSVQDNTQKEEALQDEISRLHNSYISLNENLENENKKLKEELKSLRDEKPTFNDNTDDWENDNYSTMLKLMKTSNLLNHYTITPIKNKGSSDSGDIPTTPVKNTYNSKDCYNNCKNENSNTKCDSHTQTDQQFYDKEFLKRLDLEYSKKEQKQKQNCEKKEQS